MTLKITKVQQVPVVLVKDDPKWKNALKASSTSDGMLLLVHTDQNITGIGYVGTNAPHKGVGTPVLKAVLDRYGKYLCGRDPFDIEKILGEIDQVPFPAVKTSKPFEPARARRTAKSAIDMSLHDIVGKAVGLPIYQLLGGMVREEIPMLRILAIKRPEEMARNATQLVKEGYKYLKLKMSGDPKQDLQRVRAVREAVGTNIHLTTDPNQSYSPEAAIAAILQWEQYGIEIVEQPVDADDIEGLARVTAGVSCLVEAHETADCVETAFRLVKDRVVTCIAVSLTEIGGIREARRMVDVCRLGNVKCHVAAVGSRIMSAACAHLVASTSYVDYACQLGEFTRFLNDRASGLEVENGMLRVPKGPGLGIQVDI